MNKPLRTAGFVLFFIASFVFFLYFTFPYEVLKETVSSEISSMTGFNVRIGKLDSNFPVGIEAKDVVVNAGGDKSIQISRLKAKVSLLWLLLGRISVSTEIQDRGGGVLSLDVGLNAFKLIFSQNFIPSHVELESEQFSIGQWIDFALVALSKGSNMNPLVGPLLTKLGFIGKLKADVNLDLDSSDPAQSSGSADIQFKDAMLILSDPTFNLPDQKFSKAGIQAKMSQGSLVVEKGSGFFGNDFVLEADGKMLLKAILSKSLLDFGVKISLKKALKEQFGSILDAVMGGSKEGQINIKISGNLSTPNIQTL